MTLKKCVHVIIAHPNKQSFNYALKNIAIEKLHQKGYEIFYSDLYDLYNQHHAAVSPFQFIRSETEKKQIQQEQEKIKNSQLTFVQFPLYWYTVPGLLKNYMDTVWELHFAFTPPDLVFDKSPLFDGRKVLLSLTTQTPQEKYISGEIRGPIENLIHPIELAFKYIGFQTHPAFITYNIEGKPAETLEPTKHAFIEHLRKFI